MENSASSQFSSLLLQVQRTLAGGMLSVQPQLISSTTDLWLDHAGTRLVMAQTTCACRLIQSTSQALETQVVQKFLAQSTAVQTRSTQASKTSSIATFPAQCAGYKCVPLPSWYPPTTRVPVAGPASTTDF